MRATSRAYAQPRRPLGVKLANLALAWWPVSLEPAALIAAARGAEGLQDFGEPDVDEPLTRLCAALEDEAALTPLGRVVQRTRIVGMLRNRLRAQAQITADPSILERPVHAPLVITGLQRTGTTFLHRLLSADPRARSLATWEGLNPVAGGPDRRKEAQRAQRALAYMAPDFMAVHPLDADGTEEEVILLDHSLLSTVPEATLHVPSYAAWVAEQDQTPAYALLRRYLQILDHPPGAWWVLKTPHHLEWLDTLLHVFPDAKLVHTHRDPVDVVPSFCSMVAHARGMSSDHVDPVRIGRAWAAKQEHMVTKALETRDRLGLEVLDVRYGTLTTDPMQVVHEIYAFMGRSLTAGALQAIEGQRAVTRKNAHGAHAYAPEDFGLTAEGIRGRYAAYSARFLADPGL